MSVFPNWLSFAVPQRRQRTGCIPTGYEMLLRHASVGGVDFSTFQDDFDLDINLGNGQAEARNDFGSVAAAVKKRYPWVTFDQRAFATGAEKVAFIDGMLAAKQPVLISLALKPRNRVGGWHIMPIVDATTDQYLLLWIVDPNGTAHTEWIDKSTMAAVHDQFEGGKEVAFLVAPCPSETK